MKNQRFSLAFLVLFAISLLFTPGCKKDNELIKPDPTAAKETLHSPDAIPVITSVGGNTITNYVSNGKWSPGNVPCTGSNPTNSWVNYYAMDCYNYSPLSSNPFYWKINGSGFENVQGAGTVKLMPQGLIGYVTSWTPTSITVRFSAYWNFSQSSCYLQVRNNSGYTSGNYPINVVGMISYRAFGQCTWEVANQLRNAGRGIPMPAYNPGNCSGWQNFSSSYIPQKWDVLYWSGSNSSSYMTHTGIITSNPVWNSSYQRYEFQITERNANCGEGISYRTSYFKPSTATASNSGILSNAYVYPAKKYWRYVGPVNPPG
jgi:hypothetical protein